MAEIIQYRGDSLPRGLPGFGGSTYTELNLDGISGFVRPLIFGPIVNAPAATPPASTPPTGSNPAVPTQTVVTPAAAPPQNYYTQNVTNNTNLTNVTNVTNITSICQDCRAENNVGVSPILAGYRSSTGNCYNCNGILSNYTRYFSTPATNVGGEGLFYTSPRTLKGTGIFNEWVLNGTGLKLDDGSTFDGTGIKLSNGKSYTPRTVQVCVNGATQTWSILASTS